MIEALTILLRFAGGGLILLAIIHIPIGRTLKWNEDAKNMSPANEQIFHVHTFFVCLCLVLMGLPCLIAPEIFIERSMAGKWVTGALATFWAVRLYCQFFIYRADLWRGKRLETCLHWGFSAVWLSLALLFGVCLLLQMGFLG